MKYKQIVSVACLISSCISYAVLPPTGAPDQISIHNDQEYIYKAEWKRWFLTSLDSDEDKAWAYKNDQTYQYNATEGAWKEKTPYSHNTVLFTDNNGKVEMKTIAQAKVALGINAVDQKIDDTKEAFATSVIEIQNGGTGRTSISVDNFLIGDGSTRLAEISPTNVKTKIGLGNVDNYSTAVTADAVAGVADDKFMTPKSTKEAILALSPPDELATTAEAEAGVEATKKMTPKTTKEAIISLAPSKVTTMTTLERIAADGSIPLVLDTTQNAYFHWHPNGYWIQGIVSVGDFPISPLDGQHWNLTVNLVVKYSFAEKSWNICNSMTTIERTMFAPNAKAGTVVYDSEKEANFLMLNNGWWVEQ